jgi:hypothetical protein
MSHPDSDGVAELLEGGSRAAATGALRMVELSQRRLQGTLHQQTREAQAAGEATTAQHVALTAVAHLTDRTYQEWIAAQRAHLRSGSIVAARLFPQLEPSAAAAAYLDLVDTGEHVAYLRAYDEVLDQVSRSPRRLDPSELQQGAREILAAADHAQALSAWSMVAIEEARELARLRKLLAGIGDDSGVVDRLGETSVDLIGLVLHDGKDGEATPGVEALIDQLSTLRIQAVLRLDELGTGRAMQALAATAESAAPIIDPVITGEVRTNRLRAEGLDPDSLQTALIHDLSFAEPAVAIMGARSRPHPPLLDEKKARARSAAQQRTLSR